MTKWRALGYVCATGIAAAALSVPLFSATAAPAPKPTPTPTPTPTIAPYALGYEVVTKAVTGPTEYLPSYCGPPNCSGLFGFSVEATCPTGKVPVGGGWTHDISTPEGSNLYSERVIDNRPTADGWRVAWATTGQVGDVRTVTVRAVCVNKL